MCSIFSQISKLFSTSEKYNSFQSMGKALCHRGKDASGIATIPDNGNRRIFSHKWDGSFFNEAQKIPYDFFEHTLGFIGHHRLSIINPESIANQPFISDCGKFALSYNGEIYNYIDLKKSLKQLGYKFHTSSDTEVVLASYLVWGLDCFQYFNGDFALLILDLINNRLVGARDRFGIKPLFYWQEEQTLAFSSEVKGFKGLPGFVPELDTEVAYYYLVADFPNDTTLNRSFMKGVKNVPPGSFFTVDLSTFDLKMLRYWNLETVVQTDSACKSFDEATQIFSELLNDAVRLRLRADVPLGAFLSGGLDSPSLTALATKSLGNAPPTFSSGFPGSKLDESDAIRDLAKYFNSTNKLEFISFDDFLNEIDELVYLQDEPFSTLNVYSQYKNFKSAADSGIRVILDGGGADEYLAGYADYILPAVADSVPFTNVDSIIGDRSYLFNDHEGGKLLDILNQNESVSRTVSYINPELRKQVRGSVKAIDRPIDKKFNKKMSGSYLKNALFHSMASSWMNKSVIWDNRYLDRSGMALGVEARVPFQDHRLVEFVISLSSANICNNGFTKSLLRKAMDTMLPQYIIANRNKIGFEFPFISLLRNNYNFKDFFQNIIHEYGIISFSILDYKSLKNEFQNIMQGNSNNYNIWRVFNLYLWHKQNILT